MIPLERTRLFGAAGVVPQIPNIAQASLLAAQRWYFSLLILGTPLRGSSRHVWAGNIATRSG